jgi:hypothetical protein
VVFVLLAIFVPPAVVRLSPVDLALLRRNPSMGKSQASITLVASATERSHATASTGMTLTLLPGQEARSSYTSCALVEPRGGHSGPWPPLPPCAPWP